MLKPQISSKVDLQVLRHVASLYPQPRDKELAPRGEKHPA